MDVFYIRTHQSTHMIHWQHVFRYEVRYNSVGRIFRCVQNYVKQLNRWMQNSHTDFFNLRYEPGKFFIWQSIFSVMLLTELRVWNLMFVNSHRCLHEQRASVTTKVSFTTKWEPSLSISPWLLRTETSINFESLTVVQFELFAESYSKMETWSIKTNS